jgi:hypothetical protein
MIRSSSTFAPRDGSPADEQPVVPAAFVDLAAHEVAQGRISAEGLHQSDQRATAVGGVEGRRDRAHHGDEVTLEAAQGMADRPRPGQEICPGRRGELRVERQLQWLTGRAGRATSDDEM